jgi:hypothetical protein
MIKNAGLVTVLCLASICVGYGRATSPEIFLTLGADRVQSGEIADTHYNLDHRGDWLGQDELNTAVGQSALSAEWHAAADSQSWEKTWDSTWLGVEGQDWEAALSTGNATHLRYQLRGSAADCCTPATGLAGNKWHGAADQWDTDCCSVTVERHATREWEHSTGRQAANCCNEVVSGLTAREWTYAISDQTADCCAEAARAEIWLKHLTPDQTGNNVTQSKEWNTDRSAVRSIESWQWAHNELRAG